MDSVLILGTGLTGQSAGRYLKNKSDFSFFDSRDRENLPENFSKNKEFLERLLKENPNVNLRINTNLSTTATGVFELCCKFKNVHWTVSFESIEQEYEYIRYHGKWSNFLKNLSKGNLII